MMSGTYIGHIEHLKGKTALLRVATHATVVAQFDDRSLRRDTPEPFDYDPPVVTALPTDALGFGWHAFPQRDFEIVVHQPEPLEDWQDPHAMPMRSDRSHLRGHS